MAGNNTRKNPRKSRKNGPARRTSAHRRSQKLRPEPPSQAAPQLAQQAVPPAPPSPARPGEAAQHAQRQIAADMAQIVGDASVVPLHLVAAWSRFWGDWFRRAGGP